MSICDPRELFRTGSHHHKSLKKEKNSDMYVGARVVQEENGPQKQRKHSLTCMRLDGEYYSTTSVLLFSSLPPMLKGPHNMATRDGHLVTLLIQNKSRIAPARNHPDIAAENTISRKPKVNTGTSWSHVLERVTYLRPPAKSMTSEGMYLTVGSPTSSSLIPHDSKQSKFMFLVRSMLQGRFVSESVVESMSSHMKSWTKYWNQTTCKKACHHNPKSELETHAPMFQGAGSEPHAPLTPRSSPPSPKP